MNDVRESVTAGKVGLTSSRATMARFLLLLCALVASANALLLPVRTPSGPALVQRTRPTFMQAEPPTEDVVGDPEGATEMAPDEKDGYQTYYDDEKVRPMPHSNSCLLFHALFFLTRASSLLCRRRCRKPSCPRR